MMSVQSIVLHVVFVHAALAIPMVLPGMAAAGVALTPVNIGSAVVDMHLSVFEGLTHIGDIGMSAPGADYSFGMMDHGAHGGGGDSFSSFFDSHAGHDANPGDALGADPHAGHGGLPSEPELTPSEREALGLG